MADRFPLILNTSANQIQEIASGDQLDLSGNNIANAGIITASSFSGRIDVGSNIQLGNAGVITATTFKGDGDFVDLDVDGHTNLDNVSVAGVTTFASGNVQLASDSQRLQLGSGQDLWMYHTGTSGSAHGLIQNDYGTMYMLSSNWEYRQIGTNHTTLKISGNQSVQLYYQNSSKLATTSTGVTVSGIDVQNDLDVNGHTNLDNVSIAGVTTTTEHINIDADNKRLQIGADQDFKLYHDGSHSYIDSDTGHITATANQINLNNQDNSENCATFVGNGAVTLFYNGNAKISTTNSGISVTGNATVSGNLSVGGVLTYEDVTNIDSVGIITARSSIKLDADGSSSSNFLSIGADDDLKIFHQSNVDKIESSANGLHIRQINNGDLHIHAGANTGSSNNRFVARAAGAAELYHSGTKKLETRSNGITVTGYTYSDGVTIGNGTNEKYLAGDSNQLQMYHTGSSGNGYITNNQGTLLIGGSIVSFTNQANNAFLIRAVSGGTAELYFNANKKLETTNTGVTVTGTLAATAVTGDGSGLTGITIGISTEQVTPSSNVATLDLTKDDHKIVASGTYTITCTGGTEADNHTLRIENSGTANVGFSSYFKFPSGGTPSLPTTNGAISLISFTVHKVGSVGIATVLLSGASVNYS